MTPAELGRAVERWGVERAPAVWEVGKPNFGEELIEKVLAAVPELAAELAEAEPPKPLGGLAPPSRAAEAERQAASRREEMRPAMIEWHARYSSAVLPLKRTLADVLRALDGDRNVPLVTRCRELSRQLVDILSAPEVLASPEPAAEEALNDAYSQLARLGDHCQAGRLHSLRLGVAKLEKQLTTAAATLAAWDLKP